MKRTFWMKLLEPLAVLVMIAGCGPAPDATPVPLVPLVSSDTSEGNSVKASAVVVPVQESRLSFVIPGLVKEITVSAGDQVQAGQVLAVLDTSALEYDVIAAEAALTAAEIDAQIQRQRRKRFNFKTFNFIYVSPPGEKIQEADARAEQSRYALEAAKASVAQGTLVAPFDGIVVEVDVSAGEYVRPAQQVMVIADLNKLQIETTDLSENDVAAVRVGQPASVFIEALEEEFPGKVTAISPIADTLGGDVVFKVTIQLEEQPNVLLWGMSANVEISVE